MPSTRTTDPETSHEAEYSVGRLRESHSAIYRLFEEVERMTDTTLVEVYPIFQEEHPKLPKMSPSGLRTRRKELVEEGMLRDSGEHEILPTNRKAIVWELNE